MIVIFHHLLWKASSFFKLRKYYPETPFPRAFRNKDLWPSTLHHRQGLQPSDLYPQSSVDFYKSWLHSSLSGCTGFCLLPATLVFCKKTRVHSSAVFQIRFCFTPMTWIFLRKTRLHSYECSFRVSQASFSSRTLILSGRLQLHSSVFYQSVPHRCYSCDTCFLCRITTTFQ